LTNISTSLCDNNNNNNNNDEKESAEENIPGALENPFRAEKDTGKHKTAVTAVRSGAIA